MTFCHMLRIGKEIRAWEEETTVGLTTSSPHDDGSYQLFGSYLVHTSEYVRIPETHAALITLKSSMSRQGMFLSHPGWVDPGYEGQLTFGIECFNLITVIPDKTKIVQLIFMRLTEKPINPYSVTGRYNKSTGLTLNKEEK